MALSPKAQELINDRTPIALSAETVTQALQDLNIAQADRAAISAILTTELRGKTPAQAFAHIAGRRLELDAAGRTTPEGRGGDGYGTYVDAPAVFMRARDIEAQRAAGNLSALSDAAAVEAYKTNAENIFIEVEAVRYAVRTGRENGSATTTTTTTTTTERAAPAPLTADQRTANELRSELMRGYVSTDAATRARAIAAIATLGEGDDVVKDVIALQTSATLEQLRTAAQALRGAGVTPMQQQQHGDGRAGDGVLQTGEPIATRTPDIRRPGDPSQGPS